MSLSRCCIILLAACLAGCSEKKPATAPQTDLPPPAAAPLPPHATEISAQIVHISTVPNPKTAEYANCRVVSELRVLEIHAGERCPQHLTVAIPAFRERKLLEGAMLKLGDLIRLQIVPAEVTPGHEIALYEESDDIDDLHLPHFYAGGFAVLATSPAAFPERPAGYFADQQANGGEPSEAKHIPYSDPPDAAEKRRTAIEADKKLILDALARHGGEWAAWQSELAPFHADLDKQVDAAKGLIRREHRAFSRIQHDEYEKLARAAETGESGPLRMLTTLNMQLEKRGIDLIVVPFPHKDIVQAGHFSELAPPDGWHSPWRQKFILHLLEAGLEVVDLVPALQKNEAGHEFVFYDAHDLHPADGGIQIAAAEIARRLGRYGVDRRPGFHPAAFTTRKCTFKMEAHILLKGFPANASYTATQVLHADGTPVEIGQQSASPIIIMGDSFTVCPAPGVLGANLPAHLARHLGEVPCQLLSLGSSHKTMRTLAREGARFFSNRCAIVFVFGPNRLFGNVSRTAGGGWDLYNLPPIRID